MTNVLWIKTKERKGKEAEEEEEKAGVYQKISKGSESLTIRFRSPY